MKWAVSRPNHKVGAAGRHQRTGPASSLSFFHLQVLVPALMVTAGHDPVLLPSLSKGMENLVRKPPHPPSRKLRPLAAVKSDASVSRSRI